MILWCHQILILSLIISWYLIWWRWLFSFKAKHGTSIQRQIRIPPLIGLPFEWPAQLIRVLIYHLIIHPSITWEHPLHRILWRRRKILLLHWMRLVIVVDLRRRWLCHFNHSLLVSFNLLLLLLPVESRLAWMLLSSTHHHWWCRCRFYGQLIQLHVLPLKVSYLLPSQLKLLLNFSLLTLNPVHLRIKTLILSL